MEQHRSMGDDPRNTRLVSRHQFDLQTKGNIEYHGILTSNRNSFSSLKMKLLLENVIMIIIDKVLLKFYNTINNTFNNTNISSRKI